jgi:2'-5' RNA ligase
MQAIRRRHDKQIRRWMPHITLLYPFLPRERFDEVAAVLEEVTRTIAPFEASLAEFGSFAHGGRDHTIWLAPEPKEQFERLHAAILQAVPECNDTNTFPGGFAPHLSIGQAHGKQEMEELVEKLASQWRPIAFEVSGVSMIYRNEPPDDVFSVDRTLPFGQDLPRSRRGA